MLLRLTEGCRVPVRLDSVAGGVETGHKISAVYFVGRCTTGATAAAADVASTSPVPEEDGLTGSGTSTGGQLKLRNMEAAAPLAEGVVDNSGGRSSGGSSTAASHQEGEANADNNDSSSNNSGKTAAALDHPPAPPPPRTGTEKRYSLLRQSVLLEPTADRLVLFRSGCVSTETLEVLGHGWEQYAVLFWMHGAKEGVGEVAPAADAAVGESGEAVGSS